MSAYNRIYDLLIEDKATPASIKAQKKKVTAHYKKVKASATSSKEEKAEAAQYFERGSGWTDRTARKNYPRGNKAK